MTPGSVLGVQLTLYYNKEMGLLSTDADSSANDVLDMLSELHLGFRLINTEV